MVIDAMYFFFDLLDINIFCLTSLQGRILCDVFFLWVKKESFYFVWYIFCVYFSNFLFQSWFIAITFSPLLLMEIMQKLISKYQMSLIILHELWALMVSLSRHPSLQPKPSWWQVHVTLVSSQIFPWLCVSVICPSNQFFSWCAGHIIRIIGVNEYE